jgi:hypothetical protein
VQCQPCALANDAPLALRQGSEQGPLLQQIGKTTDPDVVGALAKGLQAMAAKLTETQAQQVLAPLLQQIGNRTDPNALRALAEVLQMLPAKLTEVQAQHALAPLLQRISRTTVSDPLRTLAEALQAVAAKLTKAQAQRAFTVAMSSLAWAATEDEAADWARAVVALLPTAADQADQSETRKLVSAIVYPFAAGPATEVLLDALRARPSRRAGKRSGNDAEPRMDSGKVSQRSTPSGLSATTPADVIIGPEMSRLRPVTQ